MDSGNTDTNITINAELCDATAASGVQTRGSGISGTAFYGTMGIFMCRHEEDTPTKFVAQNPGYNNMKASYYDSQWEFWMGNGTSSSSQLTITSNKDGAPVDFYAYTPYLSGVTSPESVPFTVASINAEDRDYHCGDLMWAEQNNDRSSANMGVEVDGNPHTVSFTFHHLLARIRVGFKLHDEGSRVSLTYSIVHPKEITEPATVFYGSGCMNAINGQLTDLQVADSLAEASTRTIERLADSEEPSYTYLDMLAIPTEIKDNVQLDIFVGGKLFGKYILTPDMFKHSDGTTCGLQAGYTYTFEFVLDNYVHFTGMSVSDDWTDGEGIDFVI